MRGGLLEDLALVELAALAVHAAPREVVLDQLLGLGAGGVQFLPVVRLVVDLKGKFVGLIPTTDKEQEYLAL